MTASEVLGVLAAAADAVVSVLQGHTDWGPSGRRSGQYRADLVADAAVRGPLEAAGLRVLSEESGLDESLDESNAPLVVVDPLDGSTNASRGLPWYATSLCAVDAEGPSAAVVHDHASGRRYTAVRGEGAACDGAPLPGRAEVALADAIVAANGPPPATAGWAQFRCFGATALDLCAVAEGRFDGYVDFDGGLGVWDYLGAGLVCAEVGVEMVDADGRDLVVLEPAARRSPVAAPPALLADLVAIREAVT